MASDPVSDLPALWQSDFTVDNVIDYARAARELSYYVQLLAHEGFHRLVVPSRGAAPFVEAASSAWRLLAEPRVKEALPNAKVTVSSSHLVRVSLPDDEVDRFIREAEREIALGRDVLADDWFR